MECFNLAFYIPQFAAAVTNKTERWLNGTTLKLLGDLRPIKGKLDTRDWESDRSGLFICLSF